MHRNNSSTTVRVALVPISFMPTILFATVRIVDYPRGNACAEWPGGGLPLRSRRGKQQREGASSLSDRPGGGTEAVHQKVEQATGFGFVRGTGGDGEDAEEQVGYVFGGDVGSEVAGVAAGIENQRDRRQ